MDQTDAGSFAAAVPSESFRKSSARPTESFVEFDAADIQGSVPERFETIVQRYGNEIAVNVMKSELALLRFCAMTVRAELLKQRFDDLAKSRHVGRLLSRKS